MVNSVKVTPLLVICQTILSLVITTSLCRSQLVTLVVVTAKSVTAECLRCPC